jgi:hypothetical protein
VSGFRVIEGDFGKKAESDPRAVKFLREALAMAEAGGVTLAMIILMNDDGSVTDGWSPTGQIRPYTMVGALESIKREFMDRHIQLRDDR